MAKSTFSGPVKSLAGFISAGVKLTSVSLTADTTLTVAAHAGKILFVTMQMVNLLYLLSYLLLQDDRQILIKLNNLVLLSIL